MVYESNRIVDDLQNRYKKLGLSQTKLAKLTGYQQTRLSVYFSYVTIPRLNAVIKIAEALGLKVYIKSTNEAECISESIGSVDDFYKVLTAYRKSHNVTYKQLGERTGHATCYCAEVCRVKRAMRLDICIDVLKALDLCLDLEEVV